MLLLTDRPEKGVHLQKVFDSVLACDMLALEDAPQAAPDHNVIACHADLDRPESRKLLDCALTHHRATIATPVLFLVPDNNSSQRIEAAAFGATEILSEDASRARLLLTIRRIVDLEARSKSEQPATSSALNQSVEAVGGALSQLLSAAGRREILSVAVLDRGADALVTAIRQTNIKAWLTVVRRVDNVTFQHCLLVAGLVTAFAQRLGLTAASQQLLAQAALVHDVGKAQIPLAILNKNGPLTPAEMQVMQKHPVIGHDVLSRQAGIQPMILDVVRHHHEFLDGTGYPDRLKGGQIADFVRITTICDIYGALLERRAYKAPMSPLEARALLHGMGGKLDPDLLQAFDAIIQDS